MMICTSHLHHLATSMSVSSIENPFLSPSYFFNCNTLYIIQIIPLLGVQAMEVMSTAPMSQPPMEKRPAAGSDRAQ